MNTSLRLFTILALAAVLGACADAPTASVCATEVPPVVLVVNPGIEAIIPSGDGGARRRAPLGNDADVCRFLDVAKTRLDCGKVYDPTNQLMGPIGPHLVLRFGRSPSAAPTGTVLRVGRDFTVESISYHDFATPSARVTSPSVHHDAPVEGFVVLTVNGAPAVGHDVPWMRARGRLCGGALTLAFDTNLRDARAPPRGF